MQSKDGHSGLKKSREKISFKLLEHFFKKIQSKTKIS